MSEWKELKIYDLPADILVGNYEWEFCLHGSAWTKQCAQSGRQVIMNIIEYPNKGYRYRKPEQKAPTHEEIMTKWWRIGTRNWVKCIHYSIYDKSYIFRDENAFLRIEDNRWFIDRQSADIPPEAE